MLHLFILQLIANLYPFFSSKLISITTTHKQIIFKSSSNKNIRKYIKNSPTLHNYKNMIVVYLFSCLYSITITWTHLIKWSMRIITSKQQHHHIKTRSLHHEESLKSQSKRRKEWHNLYKYFENEITLKSCRYLLG